MSASSHLEPCVVTHGAGSRVAELWLGAALFGLLHAENGGVVLRLESVARGQWTVSAEALERALTEARESLTSARTTNNHEGVGISDVVSTNGRRVHAPPAAEPVALEEFIADVLRVAHRTAHTVRAPEQERGIHEVAELFADELVKAHPRFDRARFIEAAIGVQADQSHV